MKKTIDNRWTARILSLLPLLLVAFSYSRLPEQIPIHFGFDGAITYGAKYQLCLIASIAPLLTLLFEQLPRLDPRKTNYERFVGYYNAFKLVMVLFFTALTAIEIYVCFNPSGLSVSVAVTLMVGLLFTVIGNMMPKFKSNYFMGIKTPWTLSSVDVWNKTHRLSGWLWFFGGLLIMACSLILTEKVLFVALMIIVTVLVIVPCVMSCVWFRREEPKTPPEGGV